MKKFLAMLLCIAMLACAFAGCSESAEEESGLSASPIDTVELKADYEVPEDFKIGFICLAWAKTVRVLRRCLRRRRNFLLCGMRFLLFSLPKLPLMCG